MEAAVAIEAGDPALPALPARGGTAASRGGGNCVTRAARWCARAALAAIQQEDDGKQDARRLPAWPLLWASLALDAALCVVFYRSVAQCWPWPLRLLLRAQCADSPVPAQGVGPFERGAADLVWLAAARCAALVALAWAAVSYGTPPEFELPAEELECAGSREERFPSGRCARESSVPGHADPVTQMFRDRREATVAAARLRNALLGAVFVCSALSEVYVGVKCVVFRFGWETFQASVLGIVVFLINVELWLCKIAVSTTTHEKGVLFPQLHHHKLFYDYTTAGHCCDFCRSAIREAYRCNSCDYDLCMECFKKKDKARGENQIRGDSGVKDVERPSNYQYLCSTLNFAKGSGWLVTGAFACLTINSLAALLLPNYQGSIIDSVIQQNRHHFSLYVGLYITAELINGVFSSIRDLCFRTLMSRMELNIRNRMFASILHQDIAFFDGITSGEVTSRLAWDTEEMLSPAEGLLTSLMSSLISLVGGLFMCLLTSWRLSILAFTTVGPICLVTHIYAKWSKHVNKEIWAAHGDANSTATQAISNIRTVRAFSMEERELTKYLRATAEALAKRVKDSFVSAGAVAITNFVDLSIGILILWYGGGVAMNNSELLTVGNLLTFQLYWNLLNTAYNTLVSQMSRLTRAGGAAQRVMGLLENLPDIDPDSGIQMASLKGYIEVQHLQFFYQMRPENIVLQDVSLKYGLLRR
eukprot:TRINITY_DN3160_c0_g1_i4.p1 TRINITY_DN3160_c0_g1~~TRINITY_DN3160_c0_g1_i4.p1  ORF type:complete len:703 (-),score=174.85 TRINITY_DN3160_c0_g1_i4:879-2987(-)